MRFARHGGRDRTQWFAQTRLRNGSIANAPVAHALGLCAGSAATEIDFLACGAVQHFDLMDRDAHQLGVAWADAKARGLGTRINCIVADASTADLGNKKYDLITIMAALHCLENIDEVLQACDRALKPGGLVWISGYVGPDHFQFAPEHAAIADEVYARLDPVVKGERDMASLALPTREEVVTVDPQQAVCASQIIASVRARWPGAEFVGTYGTLAFMLSWSLNHDALYDTEIGMQTMKDILQLDAALIDGGRLPHYYGHLIARKPADPVVGYWYRSSPRA